MVFEMGLLGDHFFALTFCENAKIISEKRDIWVVLRMGKGKFFSVLMVSIHCIFLFTKNVTSTNYTKFHCNRYIGLVVCIKICFVIICYLIFFFS